MTQHEWNDAADSRGLSRALILELFNSLCLQPLLLCLVVLMLGSDEFIFKPSLYAFTLFSKTWLLVQLSIFFFALFNATKPQTF